MSTNDETANARRPALRLLDRLVGTWAVDGPDIAGTVRYEWMEGNAFIIQHVDRRLLRGSC